MIKDWTKIKSGYRGYKGTKEIKIQKVVRNTTKQSQTGWRFIVFYTNNPNPIYTSTKYKTKKKTLRFIRYYMRTHK